MKLGVKALAALAGGLVLMGAVMATPASAFGDKGRGLDSEFAKIDRELSRLFDWRHDRKAVKHYKARKHYRAKRDHWWWWKKHS